MGLGFPQWMLEKWQKLGNLLADIIDVPVALIMVTYDETMEVLISSESEGNPYKPGDSEAWHGLYCERVIKTQEILQVPNALNDSEWDTNPDIKHGMISYLGLPINFPDKTPFGTVCVLDSKENHFSAKIEEYLGVIRDIIESDIALRLHYNAKHQVLNKTIIQKSKELAAVLDKAHKPVQSDQLELLAKISKEMTSCTEELLECSKKFELGVFSAEEAQKDAKKLADKCKAALDMINNLTAMQNPTK